MNPIDRIENFFGIPESWAKVYFYLLQNGSGTIGSFQKQLNINRQQIYNILDYLVAEGFVVITSNSKRGNIYKANMPNEVVNTYIHKLEVYLQKKREDKDAFLDELFQIMLQENSPSLYDHSFQGKIISRDEIAYKLNELINDTIHNFKVAIKDFNMGLMYHIHPAIKQALERTTTTVKLLLDNSFMNKDLNKRFFNNSWFPESSVQEWLESERLQIRTTNLITQNYIKYEK